MSRYLSYTNFVANEGISHQKSNLVSMAKEAFLAKRVLCLPCFHLHAKHNHGRQVLTTMEEYYDMGSLRVEGEPVETLGINREPELGEDEIVTVAAARDAGEPDAALVCKDVSRLSRLRPLYEDLYPGFRDLRVELGIHPSLTEIGDRIADLIAEGTTWIHVRRGDRTGQTDEATRPEHIHRQIARFAPGTNTIYIATDEREPDFFAPLREHYELLTCGDFPELEDLGAEDNYRLFLVEQVIGARCAKRLSTFRTASPDYHGYLHEDRGWQ